MDEAKIIEAIQTFGTPVWEATRLRVKLAGFFGLLVFPITVWISIKLDRLWSKELIKEKEKGVVEHTDAWMIRIVGWLIAIVSIILWEGTMRFFATDYYAYKALLP